MSKTFSNREVAADLPLHAERDEQLAIRETPQMDIAAAGPALR